MKAARDVTKMFPLVLYMNSHVKARLAFELGFSGCLPEAYSILRDAIESAAHGHKLFSDPKLLGIWLRRNDGIAGSNAFDQEFQHYKEERLFEGIGELHKLWKQFSESGSHTNMNSIVQRFVIDETPSVLEWRVNYTGVNPRMLAPALFQMILTFHLMEGAFFNDCQDRLKLDVELDSMRRRFEQDKEKTRQKIIVAFNIQRPSPVAAQSDVPLRGSAE